MNQLLQSWITRQAQRRAEATAVVLGAERLSYGELEEASNRLARLLVEAGCRRGDRVCLYLPKSPAAVIGLLGILKADCAYVPIDASSPAARVAKILDASNPRLLLAAGHVVGALNDLLQNKELAVGWLGREGPQGHHFPCRFTWADVQSYSAETPVAHNTPEDIAHILFTSGSTGTPKGVVIPHANVIHFVNWAVEYFGISPDDRVSGHSPLHFDLSTFDMFGAFAAGAQLHQVPAELNLLPNKMAAFIRDAALTQWFSVPSALSYMAQFDVVKLGDFPALRRLMWCGEVFPTPSLVYWMKRLPHVTFTNLYGPTEATIASSYYTVPACPTDDKAAIPIGQPCAGEQLYVLDEQLRPVPVDEIGDLYIGGVGLSPGYWNNPEQTRAVFVPNPFATTPGERIYKTGDLAKVGADGLVYFIGRCDSQIKSRGYRIELGEIETALHALPLLQEVAVVAIDADGFEGKQICCAYVPVAETDVSPLILRKELSKAVPAYMLPSRWRAFAKLPVNANGKIDRRQLRELFQQEGTDTSPALRAFK